MTIENVSLNPLRTGLLDCLRDMGATIKIGNERISGGEAIGDVSADHSALHGINVPAMRAPSMIDEYPILAMAAACATGDTVLEGVGELRVKSLTGSVRLPPVSALVASLSKKLEPLSPSTAWGARQWGVALSRLIWIIVLLCLFWCWVW